MISYGALAQDEAAPPPAAAPEAAPPAAAAPEAAPAPAPAPAAAPAAGGDYVSRGLTLSAGTFQVTLPVVIGLDKGAAFKKIQIPLDLRYGVTNELEVFATHSFIGTSPVFSGGGVCIGDKNPYCPKVYNNVAVGGQYSLLKQPGLELSGLLAVDIRAFSPDLLLDIDVGVGFKYSASPIAVKVTPVIGIGANKRSTGNIKQFISVPVQVAFQATPELALFVDTGIFGMSDHFSDNYIVPAGLGASFAVQKGLDVGAEFMFTGLVTGVKGDKAMDARSAMVFAAYRTN
ncbi:MAG TPA: hypothetical protein VF518_09655 [Polyangia bacterium]